MGMTVSELLAASLAAHQSALPRKGKPRDMAALQRAADLRLEAIILDPTMSDPAWKSGRAVNGDLIAFYAEKLPGFSTAYEQAMGQALNASYGGNNV